MSLALNTTVVTVAYNSMAVLPSMLASLPDKTPVVIVDNASQDIEELKDLSDRYGAALVRNERNKGFGVACNQGAALAETEFLLFLNPDAELQPGAIEALVNAAERYPEASAFNPKISDEKGKPAFKRHSHLMPRSEKMARGWPEETSEVSVLSGAAIFVRKKLFDAVGGFDEKIFLYHEDDDLARRLKRDHGPLMFIREANMIHLGGRSSERTPSNAALKAWHMGRSRVYAARKHGVSAPFIRALHSALRQLISVVVLTSPRKRAKQTAYLKGVWSTLKDGGAGEGLRNE